MNQPTLLVRVAAIGSSVLLVMGFILYRSGALDGIAASVMSSIQNKPTASTRSASSTGLRLFDTVEGPATGDTTRSNGDTNARGAILGDSARGSRSYFPGSKSGVPMISVPPGDTPSVESSDSAMQGHGDSANRDDVFMGSSKSMAPLVRAPGADSSKRTSPDTSRPPRQSP